MKKKIFISLLVIVSLFMITGCGNKDTNKNNNANNSNDKETMHYNEQVDKQSEKINCDTLKDIRVIEENGNNYTINYITNNGDYYTIGNYSDGTNCKKKGNFTNILKADESYIDYFKNNNDFIKVDGDHENYYMLKNDGKIYYIKLNMNFDSKEVSLVSEELFLSFDNEKIIDFGSQYGYNGEFKWVKTDKVYYVRKIVNYEECNKYDDVECKEELVKSEYLTNRYNDISYIYGCNIFDGVCGYVLKDGTHYKYDNV